MTPPHGRPTASHRIGVNGSGRSASSASVPQTLREKLDQELGAHRDALSRLAPAALPQHGHRQAIPPASGSSATNSPNASGPHHFYPDADEDGEERMPIPSTWRTPPAAMPTGWLARQLKAGIVGLALGLVAVIPTVLWLTGRLDAQISGLQPFSFLDSAQDGSSAERASAPVLLTAPQPAARPLVPAAAEKDSTADVVDELLNRAAGFIADGNMVRARETLGEGVLADNPRAAFALAETFDPNILAATGAQGTRAEVERARMLYGKALAGGVAAARRRLDALN